MTQLAERIREALVRLWEATITLVPAFVVLLVCVLAGIGAGALLRLGLRALFRAGAAGASAARSPFPSLLQSAGVRGDPSRVAGAISFWATIVVALALGVSALEEGGLRSLLHDAFSFLPRLLAAGLLVLLGTGAAEIARRSVLLAAVNAGLPWARNAARLAYGIVLVFSIAAALDQVGIARSIIVAAFSIVGGGLVLALALAFGLGAKDLARAYLEKRIRAEEEDTGIRHV